jgi:ferredoxin-thioredoxin reductase catalytic subunit
MNKFVEVESGNNLVDSIADRVAERLNEDGGTDVMALVDGLHCRRDRIGYSVCIEYYNHRKPNDQLDFDTFEEADAYFSAQL